MRPNRLGAVILLSVVALPLAAQSQPAPAGVANLSTGAAVRSDTPRPATYGTSVLVPYTIGAYDFVPADSGTTYTGTSGTGDRYLTSSGSFFAPVHVPSGAQIQQIWMQGCNSSASGSLIMGLYSDTLSGGSEVQSSYGSFFVGPGNSCGSFYGTFSPMPQVDNVDNTYYVLVYMDTYDGSVRFTGVRLYYLLQVSPAPGSATFGDVPTSSPQFQFVEALVAAGITAGCGGGNYCPNNPVTRGQMAVFLAKALGLHWQ